MDFHSHLKSDEGVAAYFIVRVSHLFQVVISDYAMIKQLCVFVMCGFIDACTIGVIQQQLDVGRKLFKVKHCLGYSEL